MVGGLLLESKVWERGRFAIIPLGVNFPMHGLTENSTITK
jgi:hypothetical protein